MATHELPILGANTAPDSSGKVYFEPLEVALTLGTAAFGSLLGLTIEAPAGAGDCGFYGKFNVPQNYVGTPVLVIRGVVAEGANDISFGIDHVPISDGETIDVAFADSDIDGGNTVTDAAEDLIETTITLTPTAAFVAGDEVFFYFYRDDTNDDQTGSFHLTGLFFKFADS